VRREVWLSLLDRLARLTEGGGGGWQTTDLPGAYILGQPSGSVVVRLPSKDPLGVRDYIVEVRDPDGQVRAELSVVESSPSVDTVIDTAPLLERVKRLVTAIEEGDRAAEDLAEAIVSDAELGNQ
jgi:hypothetical protein